MSRNYHVVKRPEGGWVVRKEGGGHGQIFSTQHEAIEHARHTVRSSSGELFIHSRDGMIRERDSYGHDPSPPRDRKH